MPLDYRTEEGPRPDLAIEFGLEMSRFAGYEHRTRHNIRVSDGTIIFIMGSLDGGSYLTRECAVRLDKPVIVVMVSHRPEGYRPMPAAVRRWITERKIAMVNVAGNRESKSPGIGALVEAYMLEVLKQQ